MKYGKWAYAVSALSTLHVLWVAPTQAQVEPLPIAVAAAAKQFRQFSHIYVSPDGRYVAYTIRDYGRVDVGLPMNWSRNFSASGVLLVANYATDIYVTDLGSGETRNITGGRGSNWAPAWSARGDRLAFVSDRDGMARVWVWHAEDDRLQRVSRDPVVVQFFDEKLVWVNDDTEILAEMLPAGVTFADQNRHIGAVGHTDQRFHPESSVTVFTHFREPGGLSPETTRLEGYPDQPPSLKKSLGLVNVGTGHVRILEKDWAGRIQAVDANGRYLLATHTVGVDSRNAQLPVATISTIDLRSGETVFRIEEIASGPNPSYVWSPAAARFAYFVRKRHGANERVALFLADVTAAETRRLTTFGEGEQFYGESIAWLPDGRSFVVKAGDRAWIVDVDGGSAREVELGVIKTGPGFSRGRGFHLLTTRRNDALWQPPGATNVFYVQAWDDAGLHQQINEIDIVTGEVRTVSNGQLQYGTPLSEPRFDASRGGQILAFVAGDAAHPREIWLATSHFGTIRRITNLHAELDGYTFGRHRLVEWTGTDGKRYRGTLILPAGYVRGERYPTVVWQRAGLSGPQMLDTFGGLDGQNWQVLATRGYAVFFPEFNNRKASDIPRLLRTSLLPALDTLVAMGISDPERFGITGESLGGYVTMSIIALTDRFAAAINTVGHCDAIAFSTMLMTSSGIAFRINDGPRGTPWSDRKAHIEASPFYQLDKIHTPVLMAVSRGDWTDTLPQYSTDGCYVGLRHLNQTDVQYAIYSGGHGPFAFSYADRIDWWSRVLMWFDRYLKDGDSSPAGSPQ